MGIEEENWISSMLSELGVRTLGQVLALGSQLGKVGGGGDIWGVDSAPHWTADITWRHILFVTTGDCFWHLGGRGQGDCQTSYNAEDRSP